MALVFWYGSTLLKTREYTIIEFFVVEMAVILGVSGAGQSFSFAPDITQAKSAALDVARLLDHTPEIDVWSDKGIKVDSLQHGQIEFRNVYFRYPSRYVIPLVIVG